MDPYEAWEVHDTRGFVMRQGYRRALLRRRKADAPQEMRGRHKFSLSVGSAGGHGCPARCGMCKPGRRSGHGGCRALKKVGGRNGRHNGQMARQKWLDVVDEARSGFRNRALEAVLPLHEGILPLHDVVREASMSAKKERRGPARAGFAADAQDVQQRKSSSTLSLAFGCPCCSRKTLNRTPQLPDSDVLAGWVVV
eukprot:TRINITY_DN65803_c0_g1_i1.p2 TRINITY_DN65803_c0_g1~~TRINITY_DN65803_c0_g1_i1.p2  ORF type:complete len:196 (-),score=27.48 TRINITY_DN65803_c0_g1_i1:277-864(-)